MSKLEKETRQKLVEIVSERYAGATRRQRTAILNEFVAVTGYHRKYAIRLLGGDDHRQRGPAKSSSPGTTPRRRLYDEAVQQALVVLWEASDRVCGKRLKPLLPVLVEAMERHGHLNLDTEVQQKLMRISPATIDRLLAPTRSHTGAKRRRRPAKGLKQAIPVKTAGDWNRPVPGHVEVDLVSHSGGIVSGNCVHSLVLTDVSSGWTECAALTIREASLVVRALEELQKGLPFRLSGIHTDNGSEFINETLLNFCRENEIEFTRSRPYRKNDGAWVEQKNGSVVRRLVGYGRLEGLVAAHVLARLYVTSRLFVNFFQPSFKLIDKHREGGRVRKRYEAPETPCGRLLKADGLGDESKQRLKAVMASLDPLRLLDEIRSVQHHLAGLASGLPLHGLPQRDIDLETFLSGLRTAWRDGEVRPTHQKKPRPARHWRTRKDPFADVWGDVLSWLEAEPESTAKALFQRLQGKYPGDFKPGQLRTLQRRVREWRKMASHELVFGAQDHPQTESEACGQ